MASYTYQSSDINGRRKASQGSFLKRNWFECLILIGLFYLILCRDVHLTIGYKAPDQAGIQTESLSTADINPFGILAGKRNQPVAEPDPAVLDPLKGGVLTASLDETEKSRLEKCHKFIERFAKVAIAEQEKFGVPASVLLGQALIASKAGESNLATSSNNYFFQLCQSSGDCVRQSGIDYLKLASPWESFRAQSLYLSTTYKPSLHANADGKAFAQALFKEGYYSEESELIKLLEVIDSLDLLLFDGLKKA